MCAGPRSRQQSWARKLAYVNQEFPWTVTVRNNGDAPVSNVIVRATIAARGASEGRPRMAGR